MVGEGIETCLAALQLPVKAEEVIVLADGDDPGEAAALDAARRWKRKGRTVRIARPPVGMDFNDVLFSRVAGEQEGAA